MSDNSEPKTYRLLMIIGLLLITWGVLLPRLSRARTVRNWIEPLRDRGINPAGMYYTDVFESP